jgi:predicted lipoprotein with Yx(FWY)xxD motif
MNTWRSASLVVSAVAVMALTTACGSEDAGQTSGQSLGNAAAAQPGAESGYGSDYRSGTSAAAGNAQAEPAGQLAAWESKELGDVVTDGEGFTLYRFDKDTAEPSKSNCVDDCATTWPIALAEGAEPAPGVDEFLLGEITRADGTRQLTIGGWPMYRYAQDAKPGDAKGQGVGGTWYASAPEGKKASAEAADAAAGAGEEEGAQSADLPGLSTREDPELGEIVIDKNGMTVYRFDEDAPWPMKSNCIDDCLDMWPAVAPVDADDTRGILTTVENNRGYVINNRPDGVPQQSIECWPLYTFSGDNEPGATNGQGVGGAWYAITPDGKPAGKPQ